MYRLQITMREIRCHFTVSFLFFQISLKKHENCENMKRCLHAPMTAELNVTIGRRSMLGNFAVLKVAPYSCCGTGNEMT
jgi:hypothetical protein